MIMTTEEIMAILGRPYNELDAEGRQLYAEAMGNVFYFHLGAGMNEFGRAVTEQNLTPNVAGVLHGLAMFCIRINVDWCVHSNMTEEQETQHVARFFERLARHFEMEWDSVKAELIEQNQLQLLDNLQPNNQPN